MNTEFIPVKDLKTANLKKIYEGKPIDFMNRLQNILIEDLNTGFVWTEISDPMIHTINSNDSIEINESVDAVCDICYQTPWSEMIKKPSYVTNGEIEDHLTEALNELWNMDARPLCHIITSYCTSPVWTHYLDWAHLWIKRGREIEILDLILQLVFGSDILKLLKLPPIEALEQDDWKLLPAIIANDSHLDPRNFTREEPLLKCAAVWTVFTIEPRMIKRSISGELSMNLIPNIFYSSSLVVSNLSLEPNKRSALCYSSWKYSSIDSIRIVDGIMYKNSRLWNDTYNPPFDEFDYCQLCKNKTALCSTCNSIDLLFCPKHSAMINHEQNGLFFCEDCLKAT